MVVVDVDVGTDAESTWSWTWTRARTQAMDRAAHLHRLQPYRPPEALDTFDEFHCKMRELFPHDALFPGSEWPC